MIPPFDCIKVEGLAQLLPVCCGWVQVITEPIANHWVMQWVMTTNTYGDLCAREDHVPPKTVIGNVQTAKKVPDWEMLGHNDEDPPPKE